MPSLRIIISSALVTLLSACAAQRAQEAAEAKQQMLGMSKQQVLTCMGIPAQKAAEGKTEVWSYNSGDGRTDTISSATAQSSVAGSVTGSPGMATYNGTGTASGLGVGITTRRYCVVSVVMESERVSRVTYSGPTGGLVTEGEQCAFAVRNCLHTVAQ
jgi:hypothetical protein